VILIEAMETRLAEAPFESGESTVLVIEDEPALCDLMGRLLALNGYVVETAADAESGVTGRLAIPGLAAIVSGLVRCVEPIRAAERSLGTRPVPIVVTGFDDQDSERARAEAAGATAYLRRPWDLRSVLWCVQTVIASSADAR
jgi:CheY-like chemotaxis protein